MELNFSNKGLVSFDASYLGRNTDKSVNSSTASGGDTVLASLLDRAPVVKGINLSHNALQLFIGGETLRHVTFLDLSCNALSVLNANSLPPGLTRLNVSRNNLRDLGDLNRFVPSLRDLNISFNAFTSSGLRNLPLSLTSLIAQSNYIETLDALRPLRRLAHLNVVNNQLRDKQSIEGLRSLVCLHRMELQENRVMSEGGITQLVNEMIPRLTTLNGEPVSQAAINNKYKASRATTAKVDGAATPYSASVSFRQMESTVQTRRVFREGESGSRSNSVRLGPAALARSRSLESDLSLAPKGSTSIMQPPPMEIRLMEAKVNELRRLVTEGEKREANARHEREVLIDQIKSCAGVIDTQAMELENLQHEIELLQAEERALREPVAQVDHTFEQTHASLIAQKVDILSSKRVIDKEPSMEDSR